MAFKEMLELRKRETREKREARVQKIIKKKSTVEPLKISEIENTPADQLIDLFCQRCIKKQDFMLNAKRKNARVYSQDMTNIANEIVYHHFDELQDEMLKRLKDPEFTVRYNFSVMCLRTGIGTKLAVENIRDFAKKKNEYHVISFEAREIIKRYNQKRIPAYDGFQIDYKYIKR